MLFGGCARAEVLIVSKRTATMRTAQEKAFTFTMKYLQDFKIHAFVAEIPRPAGLVRTCARDVLLQNFLSAVKMCTHHPIPCRVPSNSKGLNRGHFPYLPSNAVLCRVPAG
jgi:hypothetical protein